MPEPQVAKAALMRHGPALGLQHPLGLQSVSSEQMDSRSLEMVSAGLHWSLSVSRQIWPLLLMLQW